MADLRPIVAWLHVDHRLDGPKQVRTDCRLEALSDDGFWATVELEGGERRAVETSKLFLVKDFCAEAHHG